MCCPVLPDYQTYLEYYSSESITRVPKRDFGCSMHMPDCMLDSGAAAGRGILRLGGDLVVVAELMEQARSLQQEGMSLKLQGQHRQAVEKYRQLLSVVRALESLQALGWPQGISVQLVQRAIEIEEDDGKTPCDDEYQAALQDTH